MSDRVNNRRNDRTTGRQGTRNDNQSRRNNFWNNNKYQKHDDNESINKNMVLTTKPLNFYDWKECFTQYAIKTYGIVGQALRDMQYPGMLDEPAFTLEDDEEAPQEDTIQYRIYKTTLELRVKKWYSTKSEFLDNSAKLFSDIKLHMCEESRIITQQRTANYETIEAESDFVA